MNFLGWKKVFRELVLGMFFQRHVNMTQQRKTFAKISNMFPLSLLNQICKNASLGLRILGREDRNGIRLVLKLEFGDEN